MRTLRLSIVVIILGFIGTSVSLRAEVDPNGVLGNAPLAPSDVSGLPGRGPRPRVVTGGFNVDTSSREQVRQFYNSVYLSSAGVPINSTAVIGSCFPGTNSPLFMDVTLRRINWFRAMAGVPAAITFDASESTKDQAAALMMSEHGALQHVGIWTNWNCVTADGTNAAGNSNLALGNNGPDAITAYIWDYGTNNAQVGHRRWILYPQTQVMATGDMPVQGSYNSANATWVFDGNFGGARPATRTPYVSWPPAGYVPYQVVYPQWSFALTNANLGGATVTMTSNGVPVAVSVQAYATGFGENSIVWYPSSLNPGTAVAFPFSGADTVYGITVSNVMTAAGARNFAYTVTLFDPATTGGDYAPLVISGPSQPAVNAANAYSCTPSANPATTGYQWLAMQTTNGNLVDNALNGLVNFTISPTPTYSIITNAPVGGGNCFHLAQPTPTAQLLQLVSVLYPSNSTVVSFKSMLAWASSTQIARVQASGDGGSSWQDLYTQAGTGGSGEAAFTQRSVSLSNYVGKSTVVRFNYDYTGGSRFPQTDSGVGWHLENIVVTNSLKLLNVVTNSTVSTNFNFVPTQVGGYLLQARGVIFTEFPTDLGTTKQVTAVVGAPQITLNSLTLTGGTIKINFSVSSGSASTFHLLQQDQINGVWVTNGTAGLTTNVPGSSYQFTTTNGPAVRFYRVQTP